MGFKKRPAALWLDKHGGAKGEPAARAATSIRLVELFASFGVGPRFLDRREAAFPRRVTVRDRVNSGELRQISYPGAELTLQETGLDRDGNPLR
ncbi:MAG: hypothetical protein H5T86_09515 [Armatimonadetes bacterium]|nr:hypothetical protein [Armatimonadota bacterium]